MCAVVCCVVVFLFSSFARVALLLRFFFVFGCLLRCFRGSERTEYTLRDTPTMFSTTNDKLGLIASEPRGEPTVPSMIFIVLELGTQQESIPYAQFSSSESQWGCSTPAPVRIANDDDSNRIRNGGDFIEFLDAGTYILIAAAQVGSFEGRGIGDVHLWMRLDGENMAHSNTIHSIWNTDTGVLVCQTVIVLEAGDQVQVMFFTDPTQGKLGLVYTEPNDESAAPGIIFSAFKSYI